MISPIVRIIAGFAAPAAMLAGAFILVLYSAALPRPLADLRPYYPYIAFTLGGLLSLAFRRGRAAFALLSLVLAYASYQLFLAGGLAGFAARTVYAALTVFVPLNLALLAFARERGTFNVHGAQRLGVIAVEAAITAWVVLSGSTATTDWAYAPLVQTAMFGASPISQPGIATMALALAATLAAAFISRSAVDASFAGAVIAFAVAANVVAASNVFAIFTAAAELMVTIAVVQDAFRLAFRDELTGLPSRRALNERLMALGRRYAVAMVDVDHFKKFNDRYGHDVGDQVLKMVGARLARVGGGGRAYRYGGEEFAVLFPGRSVEQALPHLEALREAIRDYALALRAPDRPAQAKPGKKRRGGGRAGQSLAVTVSIGVAERSGRLPTPEDVINAADRALYRAKRNGRNQVCR